MQKVLRHRAYWNFAKTLVLAPGFDRSSRSTTLHLFGRLPLAAPFLPFASRAGILRKAGQYCRKFTARLAPENDLPE